MKGMAYNIHDSLKTVKLVTSTKVYYTEVHEKSSQKTCQTSGPTNILEISMVLPTFH